MASSVLGRHQIDGLLPLAQKLLVDGQALEGLTGNMKGSGKVIRAADGAYVLLMAGPLASCGLCLAEFVRL